MMGHVGSLLKAWRKREKLTGIKVSHQAGISRTTLTRWEAGETLPRMAELEAVLTVLDVSHEERQEALAHIEAPRAVQRLREVAGNAPPMPGDLLRAIRMRLGWTQQETAKRSGIAQGTLARWERSEDWPSSERLHALCYALHAQEAELIALTQGLLAASPPLGTRLDRERVRNLAARSMIGSPLADIEFLALETHLWHLAQQEEAAQFELSYTYGCHARFLAERQRFAEAAVYVQRIHKLARKGYRDDIGWSAAVLAESRVASRGQHNSNPKRAMKILRTGMDDPFLQDRREYRAWMQSELALNLLKMGATEAALLLSQQAIRFAETVDDSEPWWRRGDYARVLLEAGRYDEALEECCACLNLGRPFLESLPFLLTGAQAFAATKRAARAAEWLQQMDAIIATYPEAAHYRASTEAMRQRL